MENCNAPYRNKKPRPCKIVTQIEVILCALFDNSLTAVHSSFGLQLVKCGFDCEGKI